MAEIITVIWTSSPDKLSLRYLKGKRVKMSVAFQLVTEELLDIRAGKKCSSCGNQGNQTNVNPGDMQSVFTEQAQKFGSLENMNQFPCNLLLALLLHKYSFGGISAHVMEGTGNIMTRINFIWIENNCGYFIMPVTVCFCWVRFVYMANIISHNHKTLESFQLYVFLNVCSK